MSGLSLLKLSKQQTLMLILVATGVTCATVFYKFSILSPASEPVRETAPRIEQISALGRLKPISEVVKVSVPATLNNDRVAKLLVQRGDRVNAGQVIAILASRDRLQANLAEAEQQVALASAKLAQTKAGAKSGEISAQAAKSQQAVVELQKDREIQVDEITRVQAQWNGERAAHSANIRRLQASLQNAKSEFDRNRQLQAEGAISKSLLDSKKLVVDTAQQQLAEAQATLDRINLTSRQQLSQAQSKLQRIDLSGQQQVVSAQATLAQITEVRPVNVRVAQAEVNRSIAAVGQARTNLADTTIRAPISGQIFEIHTQAGETVGSNGIVELGQTDRMEAVTEVYQSDIAKIRAGQSVIIRSESFTGEVRGTVHQIGLQVKQQAVSNGTPGENLDRRVVEVRVLLNPADSKRVAALTNLQVQVAIKL